MPRSCPGSCAPRCSAAPHSELLVDVGNHIVRVRSSRSQALAEGSAVFIVASPDALCVLPHSEGPIDESTTLFERESK